MKHIFLHSDIHQMTPNKYNQRKDPNFNITPLPLIAYPERDVEQIYFKAEVRRKKFIDHMADDNE